jgi:hypothetical protein
MPKPRHVYECEQASADRLEESESVLLHFDTKQDVDLSIQVNRATLERLLLQIGEAIRPQFPPVAS